MKTKIILSFFLFFLVNIAAYPYDSVRVISNDTIFLYPHSNVINNAINSPEYSDMVLMQDASEQELYFSGYLIVRLDSNSFYRKYDKPGDYSLAVTIYWVRLLSEIDVDSCRYYYCPAISLDRSGVAEFIRGKRDDISVFFYYWHYFNSYDLSHGKENVNYLYYFKDGITVDSLISKTIFTKNGKTKYIIYETGFRGETIKLKSNNKTILIPTSRLTYFRPVKENSFINCSNTWERRDVSNCGLKKDNSIIQNKEN